MTSVFRILALYLWHHLPSAEVGYGDHPEASPKGRYHQV